MKTRIVLTLITLLCASVANVQSGRAATIIVTNTNDSGPGSLRQALAAANYGDTIDATGVSGTILLTSGELGIGHNVTIDGPGAGTLVVNGNGGSSVFVNGAPDAAISGFTITNAFEGIFNIGNLTVSNCTISGNFGGGGIRNTGPHNVGGGGLLTVTNCIISGNSADYGGGIYNLGVVTISNTTISGNSADYGGGISNLGRLTMSNSTISGNVAGIVGGGVYNSRNQFGGAFLIIENSTLSGNSATGLGGCIYNNNGQFTIPIPSFVQLGSTILNAGASGGTIFSNGTTFTSFGYNLASDAGGGVLTGPGDQINTNPLLGPLQDNGGRTFTHALLPGSPAIDAGDPSFTPPPFYDQRGCPFERVFNGRIDVGSLEVQPPPLRPCLTPRPRPTPHPRP